MTPGYREVRLRRRGLTARLLQKGSGEPVLYLHGVVASKGWNPFLELLAREYTVYAPVQPGFDEVEGLETLDDVIDLALYYLDLLDELEAGPVMVVGHFLGAMVATEMAALCPHDIKGLVLSAPAGLWRDAMPVADVFVMGDREIQSEMWYDGESGPARAFAPEEQTDDERSQRQMERTIDMAAAGKFLWPIPDRGLDRRIHRVRAPVLLVWGEQDRVVPPAYAEEFTSRLEDARTAVLPRCGHLPMLERPEELAERVVEFFRQL